MAKPEKRHDYFKQDGFPPADAAVNILCEHASGNYIAPFRCFYREGAWISAKTGTTMQVKVLGWKMPAPPTFKRER